MLVIPVSIGIFTLIVDKRVSFISLFFIFLFVHVYFFSVRYQARALFMEQFAKENNFSFLKEVDYRTRYKYEEGSIFKVGSRKMATNIVTGTFLKYHIRLFNYRFNSKKFRKKDSYFRFTIFELNFNKDLPHMYLDVVKKYNFENWKFVKNMDRVKLESNQFERNFNLYIEKGEHIPALQIFTPDVMSKLMDLPGRADIEFIGNKIYIYEDHFISTKRELEETYEIVKYLVDNMNHVLKSMKYESKNKLK